MKDPVAQGLDRLANGLRPFVNDRITQTGGDIPESWQTDPPDAQVLLLFIWDHWNDRFRQVLSYVERSLVSELREFRNRWAHQQPFTEHDVYRFLEDAERLLKAVHSPEARGVGELRKGSLKRLYELEIAPKQPENKKRVLWSMSLCLLCAACVDFTLLLYFRNPITIIISVLFLILMVRLGYLLTLREPIPGAGPRECGDCGRIVYTAVCPYCEAASLRYLAASLATTPERPDEQLQLRSQEKTGISTAGRSPQTAARL